MTSILVPDEAASHLGAILLAFNRQIFASFLDEADELVEEGLTTSAILIAGMILEFLERSPSATVATPEQRRKIAEWRQLRNQVTHGSAAPLTGQLAQQVIDGIRQILGVGGATEDAGRQLRAAPALKGKYAHVRTSSVDFIARKRQELELEDRE